MEYQLTYAQYQQALSQGSFLGLRCQSCHSLTFPPLGVCRVCGSNRLTAESIQNQGTLRTFTVIRVPPQGREAPYIVAMVELEEGPWVMGNLIDVDPNNADLGLIGKKVRLATQQVPGDAYATDTVLSLTFQLLS